MCTKMIKIVQQPSSICNCTWPPPCIIAMYFSIAAAWLRSKRCLPLPLGHQLNGCKVLGLHCNPCWCLKIQVISRSRSLSEARERPTGQDRACSFFWGWLYPAVSSLFVRAVNSKTTCWWPWTWISRHMTRWERCFLGKMFLMKT